MRNKQDFTLDVISSIDEDIVNDNLNKRFALWFSRAQKKKNHWIPIVAMAAVFALIVSSIFLFLPDNSHVAPSGKQVPIYQGMTVSNEAPVVEMASNSGARLKMSPPLFGAIGTRLKPTDKPNKDTPEISGGPYYAQPNEDIYIYVHISNPDGFEILSFTLNGVKYSSYMFEAGSDLETLILKYNVGEKEGVQQYTIDAIKYVDGENIKDVRMEGERTIEVLVGNDSQDLNFTTQFDGWDLVITPKWAGTFAGEKKILSLAVYDGERLLRELTPSTTVIKDLPMDKRLLLVATYLDNGKTVTVTTVIQTPKQSEGLTITNGVVTGFGTCTDTVMYINMPIGEKAFKENAHIEQIIFGSGVTSIGSEAFSGCTKLTDIVIPSTVTRMGHGVFAGCTSLKRVVLENALISIPNTDNLFYNCTSLTSFTIPDSVTSIGVSAFEGCTSLASIMIPDNVTSIGVSAFEGCTSLASISIPDSVTSIENAAFKGCTGFTSIVIPDSVTTIGEYAFASTALTSITIPNRVTSIGEYAFASTGLTSITIPDSVTSIGFSAFNGCTGLTSITLPFVGATKSGNANTHFGYLFGAGNYVDNSSSVPSTLTTVVVMGGDIPESAFYGCSSLTNITLPDSVTSIGGYAFSGCSSLTGITIPNSVTSIGEYAFASTGLTSITIPDSVTSIGFNAFNGCTGLTSMTLPFVGATISGNANTHFGYLFGAKDYEENSSSVPSTLTTVVVMGGNISDNAFRECSNLTSITIGNSVTSIGKSAFNLCTSLTSVTIPDSVTSIGSYAFASTGLTSITIPDSVTGIDSATFWLCSSLTSVTIPDSVTSIGERAFCGCTSLTSVTIPDSVTSLGDSAFWNCSSLTSINYTGTKKQWSAISKADDWKNPTMTVTVHCSDG